MTHPAGRGAVWVLATAFAVSVAASGCGGGHGARARGPTSTSAAHRGGMATAGTAPGSAAQANSTDSQPVDLLGTFEDGGLSGSQITNAIQNGIAACMQSAGFRYFPDQQSDNGPELSTVGQLRAFRTTYGYGITTQAPLSGSASQDVRKVNDPTEAYLATLSPSAQVAYNQVLYGSDSSPGPAQGENASLVPAPDAKGCQATAARGVLGPLPTGNQQLGAALSQDETAISNDPRLAAAWGQWSSCMAAQGFNYQSESQAVMQFANAKGSSTALSLAPREIATATADFGCWLVGVHPVQLALEEDALNSLAQKYPEYAKYLPGG